MKVVAYAAFGLLCMTGTLVAAPQDLNMEAVNASNFSNKPEEGVSAVLIKAQVLLDRARFSPGAIDGRNGENMQNAIKAFEKVKGLKVDGELDDELWAKLNEGSSDPALTTYTVTEEDVKGPFTRIPEKMEEQAELERLFYSSPEELLAEKFHMDVDLLKELNPGKRFGKVGASIVVANVATPAAGEKPAEIDKIEVVKSERVLRVHRNVRLCRRMVQLQEAQPA